MQLLKKSQIVYLQRVSPRSSLMRILDVYPSSLPFRMNCSGPMRILLPRCTSPPSHGRQGSSTCLCIIRQTPFKNAMHMRRAQPPDRHEQGSAWQPMPPQMQLSTGTQWHLQAPPQEGQVLPASQAKCSATNYWRIIPCTGAFNFKNLHQIFRRRNCSIARWMLSFALQEGLLPPC